MTKLSELKKEAREFVAKSVFSKSADLNELDALIERFVDVIEVQVVPEEALPSDWDDDDKPRLRTNMYNNCRAHVLEAFKAFRV